MPRDGAALNSTKDGIDSTLSLLRMFEMSIFL